MSPRRGEQGIITAGARYADRSHSALTGFGEVAGKWVVVLLKIGDHTFAVGRARGQGNLAAPRREPLDLLQLHPVPWRIAYHGVESAV